MYSTAATSTEKNNPTAKTINTPPTCQINNLSSLHSLSAAKSVEERSMSANGAATDDCCREPVGLYKRNGSSLQSATQDSVGNKIRYVYVYAHV